MWTESYIDHLMVNVSIQYYKIANISEKVKFLYTWTEFSNLLLVVASSSLNNISTCIWQIHYIKSIKCLELDVGYIK